MVRREETVVLRYVRGAAAGLAIAVATVLVPGCFRVPSFDGGTFTCTDPVDGGPECPEEHLCVDAVCVLVCGVAPDGGPCPRGERCEEGSCVDAGTTGEG